MFRTLCVSIGSALGAFIPWTALGADGPSALGRIRIASEPEGARLLVDAEFVGNTPVELRLPRGRELWIELSRPGYLPHSQLVKVGQNTRLTILLRMTKEEETKILRRRWRRDHLTFSVGTGTNGSNLVALYASAGLISFRRAPFVITLAELAVGWTAHFYRPLDLDNEGVLLFLGTRPGFFFYLDALGSHELRGTLGVGMARLSRGSDTIDGTFTLSPSFLYVFHFDFPLSIGFGIRGLIPIEPSHGRPYLVQTEYLTAFTF